MKHRRGIKNGKDSALTNERINKCGRSLLKFGSWIADIITSFSRSRETLISKKRNGVKELVISKFVGDFLKFGFKGLL